MDIFKILAICLITAVLALVLKQQKSEYALMTVLGGGAVVTVYILKSIIGPIEYIKNQLESCGISTDCFKAAFKALGIGYVTGFIADACRDSGQTSLAGKAELAGKCAVFLLSVPLIASILQTAIGFLK